MPLPMVHLVVANRLVDSMEIGDPAGFFLGAISPDAVHMRANFTREHKAISHLSTGTDKAQWFTNAVAFTKEGISAADAFAIGYGIHLMTDAVWRETLYPEYKLRYQADKAPIAIPSSTLTTKM